MKLHPFEAYQFEAASRHSPAEKERLAKPLIETVNALGFGALKGEGIIRQALIQDAYDFMRLLFSLPPEILQRYPGDQRTLGYIPPSGENYGLAPERWKESWYTSAKWDGLLHRHPKNYWPHGEELTSLTPEERRFFCEFAENRAERCRWQFHRLLTVALNALGEFRLGLGSQHFNGFAFQETNVGNLVDDYSVQRYIHSQADETTQIGDPLAGMHRDTYFAAIVDTSKDTGNVPSLEALTHQGEWLAISQEPGIYSFNTGWMLVKYALARLQMEGKNPAQLPNQGTIEPTPVSMKGQPLPSGMIVPTWHRVVCRTPLQERYSTATFFGAHPDLWLGDTTFSSLALSEFQQYVDVSNPFRNGI